MVANVLGLLDELFQAKPARGEAENYTEMVQQSGAGVSVAVASNAEAQRAEKRLRAAGALQVLRSANG